MKNRSSSRADFREFGFQFMKANMFSTRFDGTCLVSNKLNGTHSRPEVREPSGQEVKELVLCPVETPGHFQTSSEASCSVGAFVWFSVDKMGQIVDQI